MRVNELIHELQRVKDKTKIVKLFHQNRAADWIRLDINGIVNNDNEILLGNELPPEVYEKDYKYG